MNKEPTIEELISLRRHFDSGATRTYSFRLNRLKRLRESIKRHEQDLYDALYKDLKRNPEETWVTETGLALSELNLAIRSLRRWMQPEVVSTNLVNLPSASRILSEPLGVVLIIGPWNYPFQLCIVPLIGAIAAGNCVVLKPSESAPATEVVIRKIIEESFEKEHVLLATGDGATIIPSMMNAFRFDHIFYTGNTVVGRSIYKHAADKLIPVTLELGGKSPCVVESDANISVAAKRIAVSKFSNAGQMCVAPDYVLVHETRKDELVNELKKCIHNFFGDHAEESYNYGKIINEKQFDRISKYLQEAEVVTGGRTNRDSLFIEPTILLNPLPGSQVMKDEIFGPILPVLSFTNADEARRIINDNPNPLAFYVFTSSKKKEKEWLESVSFGGGCVNNTSWHLTNHNLPFGGRGASGYGNYHGKYSFLTFSHQKAIMKTPTWFDPAIKYPPYRGKLKLFRWVIR